MEIAARRKVLEAGKVEGDIDGDGAGGKGKGKGVSRAAEEREKAEIARIERFMERQIEENEAIMADDAVKAEIAIHRNEIELARWLEHHDAIQEASRLHAEEMQRIFDAMGQGMSGVWSDTITDMVQGQKTGAKQMLAATGAMFGGILKQSGTVHVAEGFAKLFQSIWPPNALGEISGQGQVARGTAMIALGAAMGSKGGGGKGGGGGGRGGGGGAAPGAGAAEDAGRRGKIQITLLVDDDDVVDPKVWGPKILEQMAGLSDRDFDITIESSQVRD